MHGYRCLDQMNQYTPTTPKIKPRATTITGSKEADRVLAKTACGIKAPAGASGCCFPMRRSDWHRWLNLQLALAASFSVTISDVYFVADNF